MSTLPTPENLASIVILYRRPDTMALYGLPYELRRDVRQEPRHLWREYGAPEAWIWLGSPGWWGNMTRDAQAATQAFLARLHTPDWPGEWCYVRDSWREQAAGLSSQL